MLRRKPECRDWKSDWEEREEDGEAANSCLSRLAVKKREGFEVGLQRGRC